MPTSTAMLDSIPASVLRVATRSQPCPNSDRNTILKPVFMRTAASIKNASAGRQLNIRLHRRSDANADRRSAVGSGVVRARHLPREWRSIVTGPFTYGLFRTTDRATKARPRRFAVLGCISIMSLTEVPFGGTKLSAHVFWKACAICCLPEWLTAVILRQRGWVKPLGGPKAVEAFLVRDVGIPQGDV